MTTGMKARVREGENGGRKPQGKRMVTTGMKACVGKGGCGPSVAAMGKEEGEDDGEANGRQLQEGRRTTVRKSIWWEHQRTMSQRGRVDNDGDNEVP